MINMINKLTGSRKGSLLKRLAKAFVNPFTLLFAALAILLAVMGEAEFYVFMFISMIVLFYGILRFE